MVELLLGRSPAIINAYHDNHASGSGTHDCQDDTTGSGTAGTANTWKDDHGKTSSPAGICKP